MPPSIIWCGDRPLFQNANILISDDNTAIGDVFFDNHADVSAGRLCITVNYLNKISHASLGVSARKYIHGRIIAEAKNLLEITEMNVSQVADALGFETVNYFVRFFKSKTGLTPGAYKAQRKQCQAFE